VHFQACDSLIVSFFESWAHQAITLMADLTPGGIGQVSRSPTVEQERERLVPIIKEFRRHIDAPIQRVPVSYVNPAPNAILIRAYGAKEARDQVRIHLTNAKMWAGKIFEALGNPFPAELADKTNAQSLIAPSFQRVLTADPPRSCCARGDAPG
jgi:hypothetical protein